MKSKLTKLHSETGSARPSLMKKMNITQIYQILIQYKSATRGEIVEATGISTTTVRSLLDELLLCQEIIGLQLDESRGGRRAQRYALNPNRNLILILYWDGQEIVYQINDLSGHVIEADSRKGSRTSSALTQSILHLVSYCIEKWHICGIGLGVPGIVDKVAYYTVGDDKSVGGAGGWNSHNIGEQLENLYHIPVFLENDLNAIAFGFALRYADENKNYSIEKINIAYIYFTPHCTGAGIVANGNIIRGSKQFAGEVGLMPMEGNKSLDELLETADETLCIDLVCRTIAMINNVTNPAITVVDGSFIESRGMDLEPVKNRIKVFIPKGVLPEIVFSRVSKSDYLLGLSYLTIKEIIPRLPL